MAKIRFKCGCGKQLAVDEQFAGKTAKCPACNRPLQIPDAEPHAGSPPPDSNADVAAKMSTLTAAYGQAVLKRAQQKGLKAALSEYEKRVRRRNRIIAALVIPVIACGFFGYKLLQNYGVNPGPRSQYPEAVRSFLHGFTSADPLARAAAAWETADASDKDANCISQLGRTAQSDESPFVRLMAVRSLLRVDPAQAAALLKPIATSDSDLDIRMSITFALAAIDAKNSPQGVLPDTFLNAMTPLLADYPEWVECIRMIAEKRCSDPPAVIAAQMKPDSPLSRSIGAWVTAAALGPDPRMLELMRDPDPAVACSGVYALEHFLSLDAILRVQPKPDAALRLLNTLNGGLAQRLADPPPVRNAVIAVLATTATTDQSFLFSKALVDPDWFVRFAALKGLSRMNPQPAQEVLQTPVDKPPKENEWTQRVRERIAERVSQPNTSGKADGSTTTAR